MRKLSAAGLLLTGILLFPHAVFAEGNLSVSDKTAHIFAGKDSGYFYAKVENTGDEPVGIDNGKLVLFSDQDEILETSDYINSYPNRMILNPGEYTYLSEFLWNSDLKNKTIGDIKFSVGTTDRGKEAMRIPCEVSYQIKGSDSFDNYIYITFTNEDSQIRYGYYMTAALYDENGNLVYVDKNRYEKVGVHPGSTVTMDLYIDNDNVEYFEANNITIATVDALVYYMPEE